MEQEKEINARESIVLINEMIERAQSNFRKGSGNSMIFWGCAVSITAILVFILLQVLDKPYLAFHGWWLMAPAFVLESLIRKKQPEAHAKTHIDTIISMTWSSCLFFILLFLAVVFAFALILDDWHVYLLITPVILLALGMSQFVTAKAFRFRYYMYGAMTLWVGALLCVAVTLLTRSVSYQFLVLALCMIFGFVITGILQNKNAAEKCSNP